MDDEVLVACVDHERVPARYAARFEGDEILMAQLLDDLTSRKAALRRPTRDDLDHAVPGRPVVLTRTCGHIFAVNSRALKLAGITARV